MIAEPQLKLDELLEPSGDQTAIWLCYRFQLMPKTSSKTKAFYKDFEENYLGNIWH